MKSASAISAPQSLSSFDVILKIFPGKARLSGADLALLTSSTPASIRTRRSTGALKINSSSFGKNVSFDIRDVAAYLDSLRIPKPQLGRPSKAAAMAKARAAKTGGI